MAWMFFTYLSHAHYHDHCIHAKQFQTQWGVADKEKAKEKCIDTSTNKKCNLASFFIALPMNEVYLHFEISNEHKS